MKVTVTKYLNVRVGAPSLNADCYQYLAPGSELEVDEQSYKGDLFDGVDTWLKDGAGNYYWSGGVGLNSDLSGGSTAIVRSETSPLSKETQAWFSDGLKISSIWNDFETFGENVIVAVLDSGCDKNNSDIMPAVIASEKFISYAESVQDINGHGTRCISLIGCRNNFKYNIGIAPKSNILVGKISNLGEMSDFQSLIRGLKWAIANGAEIVSISHGKFSSDKQQVGLLYDEIATLIQRKEVLIIVCCGNNYESTPAHGILYPAALSGANNILNKPPINKIISVGAVDNENQLALLTLLTDYTILHAPGINIRSYQLGSVADLDSGTSMSTPIVAAIAALAISYIKKRNNGKWDAIDLREKMIDTADNMANHIERKIINPMRLFNTL